MNIAIRLAAISAIAACAFAVQTHAETRGDVTAVTRAGPWQTPGHFQTPSGPWQSPGTIQVPKGIKAIKWHSSGCTQRFTVGADALFAFDKATLSQDAEQTLSVLGPMIAKRAGAHPIHIDGFTDSIGSDAYNQDLSERRARTVRDWLAAHEYARTTTPIRGFGKNDPVAPNANPDGSDNPQGRQKNRCVDVVIETCHAGASTAR